MLDLNSIALNVFEYTSFLIETKGAEDATIIDSTKQFIESVRIALNHIMKSVDVDSSYEDTLHCLIDPLKTDAVVTNFYGLEPLLKQCKDSAYFATFARYFIMLVASLPAAVHPDWLNQYKQMPMNWDSEEKLVEKPLTDLRILLQHSLYPSLRSYFVPFKNIQFFLDFDGTLTDKDTCNVGIRGNEIFEPDTLDRQALYTELLDAYNNDFNTQFNENLNKPTIEEFCTGYDKMDYDCLQPVEDAGLFTGLQKHKVGITGRLIDLSLNASFFLQHEDMNTLYIVSQSWYKEMLQMCLCQNPFEGNLHILPSHIYSSSLLYDETGKATGKLDKLCGGCNHKAAVMKTLMKDDSFSIVIGDSLGDLSMLLQASLPILLHPSTRTLNTLHHYHIETPSIKTYQAPQANTIYIASNWSEIISVLCWHTMRSDSIQSLIEKKSKVNCTKEECELMSLTNDYYNTVGGDLLKSAIIETIEGGATMIQIRDKTEDFDRMIAHANELKAILKQYNVPLIINDRVDVAILSDVDGVHIGQHDMKADLCRRLLGPHKIMGLSAQTKEQAIKAQEDGADYLGTGAVFPTISKDDADAVGLDGLKEVCSAVNIPVVSIGGVNKENAASTIEMGACGIAVISAIFGREDIREATRELREVVDNALSE